MTTNVGTPPTALGVAMNVGSPLATLSSPTAAGTSTISVPPGTPSPGWLRSTLASFFASKKFLVAFAAALVMVVQLIATAAGVDVDRGALDRVFLALLTYVGAQGITDVGKGAQQVNAGATVAMFQTALEELVGSKKFLAAAGAALVATLAPLGRQLGIELDPASLDRIFAAILAYVGVQGVADFGKGAAQVVLGTSSAGGSPQAQEGSTASVGAATVTPPTGPVG